MNLRTVGDWALVGSLTVASAFAWRDIQRKGFYRALVHGSSTPAGSLEDQTAKLAAAGVVLFLLTRLAPADDGGAA